VNAVAIPGRLSRRQIAWRAARDFPRGACVNLGIGIPTLAADYITPDQDIVLHSENGILGLGPAPAPEAADPNLINATKQPITLIPGGCFFDSALSFAMIRGGHIDVALLGALEVAETGDLANWRTNDDRYAPGVGGAMDLAVGARHIRVAMEHVTRDGRPRLRRRCSYPLTAPGVVARIYTDLAVIEVDERGFVAREIIPGLGLDDLVRLSDAPIIPADDCRVLEVPALSG